MTFATALRRAAVAILPVVAVSVVGQLATYPNLEPWYAGLSKPGFNPPRWVFSPVWTALYVLMAYAAWRVLGAHAPRGEKRAALTVFFAQLALNGLWTVLFFGLHSPLAGLINIVILLALILVTIVRFRRIDALAALCLAPLALWVAYAAVLNFEIWRLNR